MDRTAELRRQGSEPGLERSRIVAVGGRMDRKLMKGIRQSGCIQLAEAVARYTRLAVVADIHSMAWWEHRSLHDSKDHPCLCELRYSNKPTTRTARKTNSFVSSSHKWQKSAFL